MTGIGEEKRTALQWLEANTARLSDFHLAIWEHAEPVWREYRSAADYVSILESEGFSVESGSGEMPTAFAATWGSGRPVIASYAEYDAVPGNSQQAVPRRAPREGSHPWAPGHTDPHSALGVGALAGVLAAKEAMSAAGLAGTLKLFGEPAEKVCGSKPIHAAKGYYDELDAAISYHPWLSNTTVWDTHCGSYWSCVFTFECLDSAQWADPALLAFPGRPHAVPRSPGALDAVSLMYTMTKHTKENMYPHDGSWIMNEFLMVGGQATADNLVPRIAQIQYCWRSPTLGIQQQLYRVLAGNARHAAGATNCRVSVRWVSKTRVGLPNHALAAATYANFQLVGPPQFPGEAKEFARQIQQAEGLQPMDDPFTARCQNLTSPEDEEAGVRAGLPPWQKNFTSDDYVEYTWHTPTVRLHTGKPVMQGLSDWAHWGNNALNGFAPAIDPTWLSAARTIATTVIDLVTDSGLLEEATAEFLARTGGGIGGETWVAPLLPRDVIPPVDLPWPEYVETPRGREWHLPTPVTWGDELG
jgi:aminobenzoyl-glutamate utilization protein B